MNKRIMAINLGNFGSTGMIMKGIGVQANKRGYDYLYAFPMTSSNKKICHEDFVICSSLRRKISEKMAHYSGLHGCYMLLETRKFLGKLKKDGLDMLHLHNLHDSYLNLPMLFRYIKRYNIPVVWTLHDCWSFTGHCPYFTMAKCDKWKTGCHDCPSYREYPASLFDNSSKMYKLKKKWFTDVSNMTIITPSRWLADLVKESYLKEYPVKVIYNGIDLEIFKPTPSDFRQKYGIAKDQYIILGVAFGWGKRKGLDVFIELAKRLNPEKYRIVLVGTDDGVDKQLPENIISIHRTQNQTELAEIYTAADVFVNPTREEVLGMVNIEANACGIPVLTFRTGGSPECIDETSGSVVECDDIDSMEKEVVRICEERPYSIEQCCNRAKSFDMNNCFSEYINLYEDMVKCLKIK